MDFISERTVFAVKSNIQMVAIIVQTQNLEVPECNAAVTIS